MSGDSILDDGPDMAAAELALGLLEGEDRAHALRRMLAEHGFAQEVERWRGHLAAFFDLWPPIPAPAGVLARVERSIDGTVATPVGAAPGPRRLFWPVMAGLTSVAAAALLAVIVLRPIPVAGPTPQPSTVAPAAMLVASINPVAAGTPVTAVYDPHTATLRLTAAALAKADRSAELWVIAGDGVPHSLGLLRTSGSSSLAVNQGNRTRLAAGATLAVSLEPIGGSPTGLPTGPVVAKGALSRV
ncbi:anti-sigma factor [Sphingomonas oligophenolica]|uniref:Anti-sigma factor n=1 Tax=Sphingomonas oligophenolica TaxID=301154 RepID=A0ABU9YCY0_9SPHN